MVATNLVGGCGSLLIYERLMQPPFLLRLSFLSAIAPSDCHVMWFFFLLFFLSPLPSGYAGHHPPPQREKGSGCTSTESLSPFVVRSHSFPPSSRRAVCILVPCPSLPAGPCTQGPPGANHLCPHNGRCQCLKLPWCGTCGEQVSK